MRTRLDVRTGWHPDPFGEHELRLFSPDGTATRHVSNGGHNSYEPAPRPDHVRVLDTRTTPPNDKRNRPWKRLAGAGTERGITVQHAARLCSLVVLCATTESRHRLRLLILALSTIVATPTAGSASSSRRTSAIHA